MGVGPVANVVVAVCVGKDVKLVVGSGVDEGSLYKQACPVIINVSRNGKA